MSRVHADIVKARRWRFLADLADRDVLIMGLVWLVTLVTMHFVAKSIFTMFVTISVALSKVI